MENDKKKRNVNCTSDYLRVSSSNVQRKQRKKQILPSVRVFSSSLRIKTRNENKNWLFFDNLKPIVRCFINALTENCNRKNDDFIDIMQLLNGTDNYAENGATKTQRPVSIRPLMVCFGKAYQWLWECFLVREFWVAAAFPLFLFAAGVIRNEDSFWGQQCWQLR